MKSIDLPKLNSLIQQFVDERDWEQFHTLKNLSMALSVESSELLEIFQWVSESDAKKLEQDPETMQKVEEELADIFYYLIRLSAKTNINLEDALLRKMQKNAQKYPSEKVKGSSKKYDQYK